MNCSLFWIYYVYFRHKSNPESILSMQLFNRKYWFAKDDFIKALYMIS